MKQTCKKIIAGALSALLVLPSLFSCAEKQEQNGEVTDTYDTDSGVMLSSDLNDTVIFTADRTYIPQSGSGVLPEYLEGAYIRALDTEGGLVRTGSAFELVLGEDTEIPDDAPISGYIGVTPKSNFSLARSGDNTYRLTLADDMQSGSLYRFTIGAEGRTVNSFAFQTESMFAVSSVLPADLALNVPVNSGIEITFTEQIGNTSSLESLIKLRAEEGEEVKGEIKLYPNKKKTAVFIPSEALETDTVYIISVDNGVEGISGRRLDSESGSSEYKFRTASLTEEESEANLGFYISDLTPVFSPGSDMTLIYGVYSNSYRYNDGSDLTDNDAKAVLYRFASAEDVENAFRTVASSAGEIKLSELKGLESRGELRITPEKNGDYAFSERMLHLPSLESGIYIAEITVSASVGDVTEEYTREIFITVTDERIYTQCADGSFLVWLNSTEGRDCGGREIKLSLFRHNDGWEFDGDFADFTAQTDGDGICVFDISKAGEYNCAVLSVDGNLFYYTTLTCENGPSDYFCWAYTDREVYFGSDRVNITGIIAPSHEGVKLPGYVTIKSSMALQPEKACVNADGSFTASIEIEEYGGRWSYYTVNTPDDIQLFYDSFSVTDEDKPVYTVSMEFDKLCYTFGESGYVTLRASFFDGTPASSLTFGTYFSCGDSFSQSSVTTDENGEAVLEFTLGKITNLYSTHPTRIYASCELTGLEDTYLYGSASSWYFQSRYHFHAERQGEDRLAVGLNAFDFDRIKSSEDFNSTKFPYLGAGVQGSAKVTLKKTEYVKKTEDGRTYDPITKLTTENWWYEPVYSDIWTKTYSFDGGLFTLDLLDRESGCWYTYEISYYDTNNGAYVTMTQSAQKYNASTWYYFVEGYTISHNCEDGCRDGQVIDFTVKHSEQPPLEGDRVFYSLYSTEGLVEKGIAPEGKFSLTYLASYLNGYSINTCVFDGEKYQTLYTSFPGYDYSDKELTLTLTPSSAETKPGETISVKLKAADAEGNPVSGGVAALSIVDEACFALGDQNINPLGTYYCDRFSVNVVTGTLFGLPGMAYMRTALTGGVYLDNAYYAEEEAAMGEAAPMKAAADAGPGYGAGEVYIREVFADNPLFENVYLDENGEAELNFTVPDNITEWRMTALAFSPDKNSGSITTAMRIGSTVSGVICTLPFFVNLSLSDVFVTGDDISASAKVYGSALTGGEEISYSACVTDDAGNILSEINTQSVYGKYASLDLGKPEAGQYFLTVTAVCVCGGEEYSDGVKQSFSVTDDGMVMPVYRTLTPDSIGSIKPSVYPVYLTFSDRSCSDWLSVIHYIMSKENKRLDSRAASAAAHAAYAVFSGRETDESRSDELISDFRTGGLFSLLPYSEGDMLLTAKICALIPELIPSSVKQNLVSLAEEKLNSGIFTDEKELAAACLLLASLDRPILTELGIAAAAITDSEALLYMAAAYAAIGDYSSALSLYGRVTAPLASSDGNEYYIGGDASEESIALTAAALLSASVINRENAPGMAKYIISHTSSLDLYTLELAFYAKAFYPLNSAESRVYYRVCGEEREAEIRYGRSAGITLNKSELADFEVTSYDDNITAELYYRGGITEALSTGASPADDGSISISKSITPHDTERGLYRVTVSYTITSDRDYISCALTDRIPTGCRYYGVYYGDGISTSSDRYSFGYLYPSDGSQMMTGHAGMWNYTKKSDALDGKTARTCSGTISYLIRAAAEGNFVISPAVMQNTETGSFTLSESGTINTAGTDWIIELK